MALDRQDFVPSKANHRFSRHAQLPKRPGRLRISWKTKACGWARWGAIRCRIFFSTLACAPAQAPLRKIADSSMKQPAGPAAGAKSEIVLLDQPDCRPRIAASRAIQRLQSPANHQHIQRSFGQSRAGVPPAQHLWPALRRGKGVVEGLTKFVFS